jgi:hypothetical protein
MTLTKTTYSILLLKGIFLHLIQLKKLLIIRGKERFTSKI